MYRLIVLEAGNPRSKCQQRWFPLRPVRDQASLLRWLRAAFSSCSHMAFRLRAGLGSLGVLIAISYKDTSQIGLGPILITPLKALSSSIVTF